MSDIVTKYYLHPHVYYVPRSPDEVIVRGGHLEGYTVLVTDDTQRGLAASVIDSLRASAGVGEVHAAVSKTIDVSVEEIGEFLRKIAQSGAIAAVPGESGDVSAWLSFARYGSLPKDVARRPVTIAGNEMSEHLAEYLGRLGVEAEALPLGDLDSLDRFRNMEGPPDDAPGHDTSGRLVVCVQGSLLPALYELNETAIEANVPVLYVQAAGSEVVVGPYVDPGSSACFWEFEQQRMHSFFSQAEYAAQVAEGSQHLAATALHVEMSALVHAAPFVVELSLTGGSSLSGAFRKIRATNGQTQSGSILRLPRCPVCLQHRPLLRNLSV